MAMNYDASTLLNPMLLWTDLGLRALEMTVNSTQNATEGVERMARAGASVEASEARAAKDTVTQWASTVPSGTALATDLQRSALDMALRGWVQLMSTIGSFVSMGADLAAKGFARQNVPLEAMRNSLMLPAGFGYPASQDRLATRTRRQGESRRETHADSENMEHAFASAEPKRRRSSAGGRSKAKSKARRSRST